MPKVDTKNIFISVTDSIYLILIFEITGINKIIQTFTTPDNLLGPQNAIWRLNWTYHNLRDVLFQSSQNEEVYPLEGEFFFVQVPACSKDIQEQGKEMKDIRICNTKTQFLKLLYSCQHLSINT